MARNFGKILIFQDSKTQLFGQSSATNIFSLNGDLWAKQRKLARRAFAGVEQVFILNNFGIVNKNCFRFKLEPVFDAAAQAMVCQLKTVTTAASGSTPTAATMDLLP